MNTFVAMPILRTPRRPNTADLQVGIQAISGIETPGQVRQTDFGFGFALDDVNIDVGIMDKPIPWADLEGPCKTSLIWEDAVAQVQPHQAHLIACATGDTEPKVLAWYLTKGIEAILPTFDSPGVYWGAGTLVAPTNAFVGMSASSSLEYLPLYLWIDFRCYREPTGKFSLFTTGLKALGFMEIEICESDHQPAELVDRAFNIAHYLLDNGPVLKDGDTIGVTEDERIRIKHSPSFVDREEHVYRLTL